MDGDLNNYERDGTVEIGNRVCLICLSCKRPAQHSLEKSPEFVCVFEILNVLKINI